MARVRPADHADAACVVALARAMHDESPRYRGHSFDPLKVADHFHALVPLGGAFVAETDGRIVGLLAGFVIEDFFGHDKVAGEYALYVLPEARGGSAGARLLAAFEAWGRRQGAKEAYLGITAGIDTERVAQFYERLGYQRVGVSLTKEL